ncbi:MAG: flagellin, partial [Bacteroidota bacterium]
AARSRIEDADFAKEQMEIVKLQILQQTGSAMFAQANAAPQSVLSFF